MESSSLIDARSVSLFKRQCYEGARLLTLNVITADRKEFLKISWAVGFGFIVMGAVGYVVKLSTL